MTEDELEKLRSFYHSFLNQQDILIGLTSAKHLAVNEGHFRLFWDEISRAKSAFPYLLPAAQESDFYNKTMRNVYIVPTMQSYLAIALGKIKVHIDNKENTPITETRDFSFIKRTDLRKILERDYVEIQRAYIGTCWKSVIILSGSAIEAILLDRLQQDESKAKSASQAPKKDLSYWDLADIIKVCVELKFVTPGVEKLSGAVREYRNLVHPGNEIRNNLVFNAEEAKIAVEVLHIVHRDLS